MKNNLMRLKHKLNKLEKQRSFKSSQGVLRLARGSIEEKWFPSIDEAIKEYNYGFKWHIEKAIKNGTKAFGFNWIYMRNKPDYTKRKKRTRQK